jgi:hypothetical protein
MSTPLVDQSREREGYQHCSEAHLNRYLAEFDFRQNTRAKLEIDDVSRASIALKATKGKRLTYRTTVGA